MNNEEEVYDLWDSSDDMMCNPEDHPVDFEVYQTPNSANQFFGFQYTGNISIIILVLCYLFFLKDSPLIPSMKMSVHSGSNVMLRFAMLILKIRHVQQVVTEMKQQLQRLRHQQQQQHQTTPLRTPIHIGFVK